MQTTTTSREEFAKILGTDWNLSSWMADQEGLHYTIANHNCAHMTVRYLKEISFSRAYLCHNPLNDLINHRKLDYCAVSFTKNKMPSVNKEILDWILDPENSPWAEGVKDVVILRDDQGLPLMMAYKWADPDFFREKSLFMSAIIASRMIPGIGVSQAYARLRELGFDTPTSYFLAMFWTWNGMSVNHGTNVDYMFNGKGDFKLLSKNGPVSSDSPFSVKATKLNSHLEFGDVPLLSCFNLSVLAEFDKHQRAAWFQEKLDKDEMRVNQTKPANVFFNHLQTKSADIKGLMRVTPTQAIIKDYPKSGATKIDPLGMHEFFISKDTNETVKNVKEALERSKNEVITL